MNVYLDGILIDSDAGTSRQVRSVTFDFKDQGLLALKDVGGNAVVNVVSISILCNGASAAYTHSWVKRVPEHNVISS